MENNKIVLLGSGGHSNVVKDIIYSIGDWEIVGILDDKVPEEKKVEGIYYGPIQYAKTIIKLESSIKFVITIGNNHTRKKIVDQLQFNNSHYATLIHSSVIIGSNVEIKSGTVVMPGTIINANSIIGHHCILNTGSVIEHDNKIESYVHISPNATLAGNVTVGEGAHIGIGASVIPGKNIGNWTTIGAGGVVIEHIPPHCTAVGIPARPVKFHN